MTPFTRFARVRLASGRILALVWLMAGFAMPVHGDPPPSDAARSAQLQERNRLWQEAQRLREAGKTAEAIAVGENMLAIERKLYPRPAEDVATSLDWLGKAELERENLAQAEKRFAEALEIRTAVFGAEHWRVTDARRKLKRAQFMIKLGPQDIADLRRAEHELDEVIKLDSEGDYAGATEHAEKCRQIRLRILGESHPDYALATSWLASAYQHAGNYARAEPLYRQAMKIRKAALGDKHPVYATSLNNLALLYQSMGDYARAEPLFRQALEVDRAALGDKDPEYAADLNNLAVLYQAMGDCARAEPLFRQASDIWKSVLGDKDPKYATSLNNLAALYDSMGNYTRAEPLYLLAMAIRKAALGDLHPSYATSLNNLAELYRATGDYARAEPLCRQAVHILKAALGDKHPNYATSLNNLALLYSDMGDYARAELLHRQALEIEKAVVGEQHPRYATDLCNLALLELTVGRPAEAEKHARQAAAIQRQSLDLAGAVQSERQQLAMAGRVRGYLDGFLSAALAAGTQPSQMYDLALAWKGAVSAQQQQMRAREHAMAADPNSKLTGLFAQLDQQSRKLAALYRYTPKPEEAEQIQKQVRAMAESVEGLQQQLARLDPDFHRAWTERSLSSDMLRQALPASTALVDLLEYNHYIPAPKPREKERWERRYLAFVLRSDRPVACFELGPAAPINDLVEAWRRGFGQLPTDAGKLPGDELRRLVWQPLARAVGGAGVVLVSPDGMLAELPWAALPGHKPGTFLIEERQLAVVPVPQMLPELLKTRPPAGPPASLLLTGDIDYGGDPGVAKGLLAARAAAGREKGALEFPPLEAAQGELSSIRDWYEESGTSGRVDLLRRRKATEAAFREQAPGHPWLHLITHGFFAGANPKAAGANEPTLAGMGAVLEVKDDRCLVTQVVAGGAAAKDGRLKAGDEITAVTTSTGDPSAGDWTPTAGKKLAAIVALIRGPVGTKVRIKIRPQANPDKEMELGLVRAPITLPATAPEAVDPGLLSGLAFAGANAPLAEGKDDGILTALEVAALDLSKVDTVVLSACETGLGQSAGGEGLLGLQRAFQVAGAKTVVASLWKVPDAATSRLMQRYYKNIWDRKLSRLTALQEAQIFMLRDRGNRGLVTEPSSPSGEGLPPYYWAAFTLSGDWR